jgi:glutamine amidotransferase
MHIAIIDCGAGNLHSVRKAFARVMPANAQLDIVTHGDQLDGATHIVLPGVGAFADCMSGLNALPGMRQKLEMLVRHGSTPFLGICVGMQMLFERGYEHGQHDGLGWFKGIVKPITPRDPTLKIPHMGWNKLIVKSHDHPLMAGIKDGDFAYFVHSYAAQHTGAVLATVDYGGDIVSVIGRDHIMATQFHPEKSQKTGLAMIENFLSIQGA